MPIYVRFEMPEELTDKVYEAVEQARDSGQVRKGTNEVTKQTERKQAKLVVMATDVTPEEILAHMPLLCEDKDVPYAYVPSQADLGRAAGLNNVGTASVAITQPGDGEDLLKEIVKEIEDLKGAA